MGNVWEMHFLHVAVQSQLDRRFYTEYAVRKRVGKETRTEGDA